MSHPPVDRLEEAKALYKRISSGDYTTVSAAKDALTDMFADLKTANKSVKDVDPSLTLSDPAKMERIKSNLEAGVNAGLIQGALKGLKWIEGGNYHDTFMLTSEIKEVTANLQATGKTLNDIDPGVTKEALLSDAIAGLEAGKRRQGTQYGQQDVTQIKTLLDKVIAAPSPEETGATPVSIIESNFQAGPVTNVAKRDNQALISRK